MTYHLWCKIIILIFFLFIGKKRNVLFFTSLAKSWSMLSPANSSCPVCVLALAVWRIYNRLSVIALTINHQLRFWILIDELLRGLAHHSISNASTKQRKCFVFWWASGHYVLNEIFSLNSLAGKNAISQWTSAPLKTKSLIPNQRSLTLIIKVVRRG